MLSSAEPSGFLPGPQQPRVYSILARPPLRLSERLALVVLEFNWNDGKLKI